MLGLKTSVFKAIALMVGIAGILAVEHFSFAFSGPFFRGSPSDRMSERAQVIQAKMAPTKQQKMGRTIDIQLSKQTDGKDLLIEGKVSIRRLDNFTLHYSWVLPEEIRLLEGSSEGFVDLSAGDEGLFTIRIDPGPEGESHPILLRAWIYEDGTRMGNVAAIATRPELTHEGSAIDVMEAVIVDQELQIIENEGLESNGND